MAPGRRCCRCCLLLRRLSHSCEHLDDKSRLITLCPMARRTLSYAGRCLHSDTVVAYLSLTDGAKPRRRSSHAGDHSGSHASVRAALETKLTDRHLKSQTASTGRSRRDNSTHHIIQGIVTLVHSSCDSEPNESHGRVGIPMYFSIVS